MAKTLHIEVASDVICPWCYIGKRRLERALELLDGEVEVRVSWLPFQLNPGMPKDRRVRIILPQLAFHDVRGVQLLGTSQWYVPEGIRKEMDYFVRAPS